MKGKKKKELTMGLNNASGVIWAVFIINSDPNNNDHNDNNANKWVQMMPDALFGPFSSSSPSLPFKILTTSKFIS